MTDNNVVQGVPAPEKLQFLFVVQDTVIGDPPYFEYGVWFQHAYGVLDDHGVYHPMRRKTTCVIYRRRIFDGLDAEWLSLYRGTARCGKRDQFSRSRGRQIALGRAMRNFAPEFRSVFWEAYEDATKSRKETVVGKE